MSAINSEFPTHGYFEYGNKADKTYGLTIFGLKGPSMVGSLFLLFFFFDVSRVDVLAREKLLAGNGFAIAPELV
jgi:hypothetical protein